MAGGDDNDGDGEVAAMNGLVLLAACDDELIRLIVATVLATKQPSLSLPLL